MSTQPVVSLPVGETVRFTAADDRLHPAGPSHDWTETTWWSFQVPERRLAGWLYAQVRPNLGTVSGGAFVYDANATAPWELPYHGWFAHQPLTGPVDLSEVAFRTGVSVRCLEPGLRYELGFRFRDHDDFVAALLFEGITEPVPHLVGAPPFTGSSHFDQHGRVTGTLLLHGERIDVDCIAARDRSWGRRPELIGPGRRLSYAFGAAGPDLAFLAFCTSAGGDTEELSSGYLLRDGALRRLARLERRVVRGADGGPDRIELEGEDTDGRRLAVVGEACSRMFLPDHSLVINTLIRWSFDGLEAWGEDQDCWSMADFSRHQRDAR